MEIGDIKITPNGDTVTLRTGSAPKVPDPYDYEGFAYTALTPGSFVELVKSKGSQQNAIVFMHDDGFQAILDDTVKDRPQDTIDYGFKHSTQCKEWGAILSNSKTFTIKEFSDFLKRREPREIQGVEDLLFAIQNFKYATNIAGDFSFDSRNNYTFSIKVNEAEGTVRIPTSIEVGLEVYKGSEFIQIVEIEIDILKPKEAGEQPLFHLSCPKWQRYVEIAKEREFASLKENLEGWLVVTGKPE